MENRKKAFAWIAGCLCMFCAPTAAQYVGDPHEYVEYIVKADHADRIYETGEKATVTVEAYKGGIPLDGVKLYYSTGDEMMLPEPNDSTTFRDGKAVIDMGTIHAPGFKECDLRFQVHDKTYKGRDQTRFLTRGNQVLHHHAQGLPQVLEQRAGKGEKSGS